MNVLEETVRAIESIDLDDLENIIEDIKVWECEERIIYTFGNGGSQAIANHFSTDLVKKKYQSFSPMSNSSLITMLANDYGYHTTMSKIIESLIVSRNAAVIIFSVSGWSNNVLTLKETCIKLKIPYWMISSLEAISEACTFEVQSKEPYVVESVFSAIAHYIVSRL